MYKVSDEQKSDLKDARTGRDYSVPPAHPVMGSVRNHFLHDLQRTYGNQTVMRMVTAANVLPKAIQTKLTISEPGDLDEQEADQIAEHVMRMPDPTVPNSAFAANGLGFHAIQRQCPECELRIQRDSRNPIYEEEGLVVEQEEVVKAKPLPGLAPQNTPGVEGQMEGFSGAGQSLPASVRAFMEPRFGHDFGGVRIHTNAEAATAASSVNARAFTFGPNLVFGTGQYAPATEAGQRLLAHELTHVIQQGEAPPLAQPPGEVREQQPDLSRSPVDRKKIHRVAWNPNTKTGRTSMPWGSGPNGDILKAATDAGTPINIWRPFDGTTYWCHGYTFGGSTARGGPYSLWGQSVPTVLQDDGWKREYSCVAAPGDILVFYTSTGEVSHSGIIRSVFEPGGRVDETTSTLESKWGSGAHNTSSWLTNATGYGGYRCFSKTPKAGPCSGNGANELP